MSKRDVIWVDGERELFLNMQRVMGSNLSAARQGIRAGAMSIINDAKQNLRGNHSVVTGQLRASGRVQAVQDDEDAVDAGFFSDGNGYAAVVEYGSKAGGKRKLGFMIRVIKQWLRKKGEPDGRGLDNAAFFIARSIIRKGTRPHPFFTPAVEKNKKAVTAAIQEAIRKEIDGK